MITVFLKLTLVVGKQLKGGLDSVEWNGGLEWNGGTGMLEWNGGMEW